MLLILSKYAIINNIEQEIKRDEKIRSDRPNNILKIQKLKLEDFFAEKTPNDERLLTAKASNGETVVIARTHTVDLTADDEPKIDKPKENVKIDEDADFWKNPNIGTRKTRWIEQLLTQMKDSKFGKQIIEKIGIIKVVEQVLIDTASDRTGGKAYSSIDSAMRVWNSRFLRGEF